MKTWIGSGIGRGILLVIGAALSSQSVTALAQSDRSLHLEQDKTKPFQDSHYGTAPQRIPGRVECAAYDSGGEGVAYHDSDPVNHGSGQLNPADGTYLNEFRMHDGVDTSYTKFPTAPGKDAIDNNTFETVTPPKGQLYVGWTEPGEWFNITVDVAKAGKYSADLLYTSNRGGTISLDVNGHDATGPVTIPTTFNNADPIAWRQWHHWNTLRNAATLDLPAGRNVLTVRILTSGNMNLAYFDFRPTAEK
jgi:Carbohydrate binding module (family 6)